MYDILQPFCLFTGTRDDIYTLKTELPFNIAYDGVIFEEPGGALAQLRLKSIDEREFRKLLKTHPDCEAMRYSGRGRFGLCEYLYHAPGSSGLVSGAFNGGTGAAAGVNVCVDTVPDWLKVCLTRPCTMRRVEIELSDGHKKQVSPGANNLEAAERSFRSHGVQLSSLFRLFRPDVNEERLPYVLDEFLKAVPSVSQIKRVIVSVQHLDRNSLPHMKQLFEDPSAYLRLQTYIVETEKRIYFPAEGIMRSSTRKTLHHFNGKEYVSTVFEHTKSTESLIYVSTDTSDFILSAKNNSHAVCEYCLSDNETVQIPSHDSASGLPVTEIASNCFIHTPSIQTVYIPDTVCFFGQDCFSPLKDISRLVYGDDEARRDTFIRRGGRLMAVVSTSNKITIPLDIDRISPNAFCSCPKLQVLTLHSPVSFDSNALAGCKTLRTLFICTDENINIADALPGSSLKSIYFPDGTRVHIDDPYQYSCIEYAPGGLRFSYSKAAAKIDSASAEKARCKIAFELLSEHLDEISDNAVVSHLTDICIRYSIGRRDLKSLSEVFALKIPCSLDYAALTELARRSGSNELLAAVLAGAGNYESVASERFETPAEPGPRLFIKVRFEDSRAYNYFCDFKVQAGDKVFVEGKKAGCPGEVAAISKNIPAASIALRTLNVTQAFNISVESMSDDFWTL